MFFGNYKDSYICTKILNKYHEASKNDSLKLFREVYKESRHLLKKGAGYNFAGGSAFHIGNIFFKQKNTEEAEKWFEKCLKYMPEHREAKRMLKSIRNSKERICRE